MYGVSEWYTCTCIGNEKNIISIRNRKNCDPFLSQNDLLSAYHLIKTDRSTFDNREEFFLSAKNCLSSLFRLYAQAGIYMKPAAGTNMHYRLSFINASLYMFPENHQYFSAHEP